MTTVTQHTAEAAGAAAETDVAGDVSLTQPVTTDLAVYSKVALGLLNDDRRPLNWRGRRLVEAGRGAEHARELLAMERRSCWRWRVYFLVVFALTPNNLIGMVSCWLLVELLSLQIRQWLTCAARSLQVLEDAGLAPGVQDVSLPPPPPTSWDWFASMFGRRPRRDEAPAG